MKKRILIIVGLVILFSAIILAVVLQQKKGTEADGYDIAAEELQLDFNADIMWYGENPNFRKTVVCREITSITDESLSSDDTHGYKAVVLFDNQGTMEVSDDELLLLKQYVEKKGYDMIYIGEKYLDDFERLGFTVGCEEEALSFEYIGSTRVGMNVQQDEYGNLYAEHGLWCKEDVEMLKYDKEKIQSRIIGIMRDNAKTAAGEEN